LGKKIICFILISLICSPLLIIGSNGNIAGTQTENKNQPVNEHVSTAPVPLNSEPSITIISPAAGYLYLFKLQPIKMPIASLFGLKYAVVVGRNILLDTEWTNIHHIKVVAKRMLTGWETVRWDYRTMDGFGADIRLGSGLYTITVFAYNETGSELCQESIKVLYMKVGREDFGVWVNTKYNDGETITTPLQLGITDFGSMLNTGDSRQFKVSMQNQDDTTVELRFIRTKIMNNTEKVVETKCNVVTTCDTSKQYEVSIEIRFPFIMLNGGQPSEEKNPYFSTNIGYASSTATGGANRVNMTFFVGRENISDPRVFRLDIKPENIESGSSLTFFTGYRTVNMNGDEVFWRKYSLDFNPATELTITSIPREAKISYEFGRSAGVPTKVSLRAEGGVLDDIIQSLTFNPLPSYMAFDLTIIGSREFLYESDQSYDIIYAIDSEQNGNLVTFEVDKIPQRIHTSWGLSLGTLGDLAASGFAELNMSQEVRRLALSFFGNERPFISLENLPRKIRFESSVDLLNGTGNINITRRLFESRRLNISLGHGDMVVTKSFELKNAYVEMKWKIDTTNHNGYFNVTRDSASSLTISSSIEYHNWKFSKTLELKNRHLELSWNINREQKTGEIILARDIGSGSPTLSFAIEHEGWKLDDTLQFNNKYLKLIWQLPTQTNTHAQLGLITDGGELFHNTIAVLDNNVELFHLGFGIQTDDHYIISWDYINGQISNFNWSGKLLRLTNVSIGVNLAGEVFSISADINVGQSGVVELQFNRPVAVTFIDTASDQFKIHGNVTINANRRLQVSWNLQESGYFTVYTFGQPLGDDFNLEFGYDPQHAGNYKYGFKLIGEDFIEITRTIQWYAVNGQLVRIWVLGDEPIPGDWTLQVLWNYQWYTVPWP
jgi:hypothetical protein